MCKSNRGPVVRLGSAQGERDAALKLVGRLSMLWGKCNSEIENGLGQDVNGTVFSFDLSFIIAARVRCGANLH